MPKSIFAYIFKHSMRQQLWVFLGTLIYLPILYLSFELPKLIVNDALVKETMSFPREYFGITFMQLDYLFLLCGILLALVVTTGGIRYCMSVFKGVLGEIMLRRLRYDLYTRILQFPMSHLKKVQNGEIVTMVTAEAEALGRFMGGAVANPTLQGGTMITALVFLFAQDWLLGLAAISLFPIQGYLVPKLQIKMNQLSRERLANVRLFAGHISETIDGYQDIHVHDTTAYELAKTSLRLGVLFRIRRSLYTIGNGIIFLNNFFTQLTPFMFYMIGGYLVVMGDLSLGALVAVIAAYRETATPWNDLLEYYQSLEDNRVKYAALVENFSPDGEREIPSTDRPDAPGSLPALTGAFRVSNAVLKEGEETLLDAVNINAPLDGSIAILGPAGSGKTELAHLLSALQRPNGGAVRIGDTDITNLSEPDLARYMAYAGPGSHVFTGSWRDNLYYGLKHRPVSLSDEIDPDRASIEAESRLAGNTTNDVNADWVDFQEAGFDSHQDLDNEAIKLVRMVGLTETVFEAGMRKILETGTPKPVAEKLIKARNKFRNAVSQESCFDAVEFFDIESFNTNATVIENLLFGELCDKSIDHHVLAKDPDIRQILENNNLLKPLIEIGHIATSNIIKLFRGLPAGDEKLNRFSLIRPEDLPSFESLLRRVPQIEGMEIDDNDRAMLLSTAFMLNPSLHRLGLINNRLQVKILTARHELLENLPTSLAGNLEVIDPKKIAIGSSVRDNIMFGRLSQHRAQCRDQVEGIVREIIDALDINQDILELGLDASVGVAGVKLAQSEKQKLILARCLIKQPHVLIVNEILSALEPSEQDRILQMILEQRRGKSLIWVDRDRSELKGFDTVYTMRGGRITSEVHADQVEDAADTPVDEDTEMAVSTMNSDMEALSSVPVLSALNRETLNLIAFTSEALTFSDGEDLIKKGDIGEHVFIIINGHASFIVGNNGDERVIQTGGPGTLFGEVALLSKKPRAVTVRADGNLSVLRLSRELFFDLIKQDAELGLAVMESLSNRLVHSAELLNANQQG